MPEHRLRPSHPEVRKVIEEAAENRIAVCAIGDRVEDASVPDVVNEMARNDVCIGIDEMERQESSVFLLRKRRLIFGEAFAFLRVLELHPNVPQVEPTGEVVESDRAVREVDRSCRH